MLKVRVLGSAAGGGFPQWNCNCDNCAGMRAGSLNARPRTQSSIAISNNEVDWLLVNASPDMRQQILAFPALQPARAKRDTGIRAVLLIDSQIDHATGLLMLRENKQPLELYCSQMVYQDLTTGFPVLRMLEHYCGVNWYQIPIDGTAFNVAVSRVRRFGGSHCAARRRLIRRIERILILETISVYRYRIRRVTAACFMRQASPASSRTWGR